MHSPQWRSGLPTSQDWHPGLTQRIDQLEQTNGHQANFLARLSHELRNPLAPMRHALDLLQRQGQGPGTAQTVELMQRQLAYLIKLVDELLDTERIAQGKLALNKQPVLLQSLLDDAMAVSRSSLAERAHRLSLEIPQQPIYLQADPTRLTQVMINLLVNAAKYTPPGGHVALRVQVLGDRVRLEVSDNGIGLAPHELPLIFDLYAQAASSRRLDTGGLGVGLALARQIVQLHDGQLEADSEGPGRGSRFTVELPVASPQDFRQGGDPMEAAPQGLPPPQTEGGPAGSEPGGQSLRILVVDDHVDGADTLARALQCLGHEALACHSGAQAMDQAVRFAPEVALLDLSMPGMDGYELAQQLRRRHPQIALVAMTGWAASSDRQRCLQAGFDAHLSKPASMEAIEALLAPLRKQAQTRPMTAEAAPGAKTPIEPDFSVPSGAAPADAQTIRSSTPGAGPVAA